MWLTVKPLMRSLNGVRLVRVPADLTDDVALTTSDAGLSRGHGKESLDGENGDESGYDFSTCLAKASVTSSFASASMLMSRIASVIGARQDVGGSPLPLALSVMEPLEHRNDS